MEKSNVNSANTIVEGFIITLLLHFFITAFIPKETDVLLD